VKNKDKMFPTGAARKGRDNSPWDSHFMGQDYSKAKVIAETCGTCSHMEAGICALTEGYALIPCDQWKMSPKMEGKY